MTLSSEQQPYHLASNFESSQVFKSLSVFEFGSNRYKKDNSEGSHESFCNNGVSSLFSAQNSVKISYASPKRVLRSNVDHSKLLCNQMIQ